MSMLVLTRLCVYVHYNALGLYIKLFALYKNIFFMKVIKTKNRFQQLKTGFPKNQVLTSLLYLPKKFLNFPKFLAFSSYANHLTNLINIFQGQAQKETIQISIYNLVSHVKEISKFSTLVAAH